MDNGTVANGSSLILVKYDSNAGVSSIFDLGLSYKDFSLNNTSFSGAGGTALGANQSWNLTTGDYAAAYTSFRGLANTDAIRWGVFAVDSIGSGAGSTGIIQTFNTTNSPTPINMTNSAVATQLGNVNTYINGGNFAGDKVVSNQIAAVSSAAGDGNIVNLMAGDAINGSGGLATASYNQSMNIVERLGGGSSLSKSTVAFYGTDAGRASFSLSDDGVLTFTSSATATPKNALMDNGTVTNGSSLILVKYDSNAGVSSIFDLGLSYKDFSLNNTSFTGAGGTALGADQSWNLTTGDYAAAYTSFRGLANTDAIRWGVFAVDSIGSGAGSTGIIQTFNTTNSPTPINMTNSAVATQLGNVNTYINGGNFAGDKVVSNQIAAVSSAAGDGNIVNLMAGDAINGSGGLATASYNQSMNIVERLGGGSSLSKSTVAFYGTDAGRASFSLSDDGVLTFTSSATALNKLKIAALYAAVFDRAPDQAGLNFWATEAKTSTSVFNSIANGFVQHPVFTEVYESLDNSAFVNALYVNILGAAGDAPGVAYWTGLLTNNSRASVLSEFVQASLEINLSVGAAALNITEAELATAQIRQNFITNKATVGVAFADLLGTDSNLKATTNPNTLAGLRADQAYVVSEAVLDSVTDNKASADAQIAVIKNATASGNALSFLANLPSATSTMVETSSPNPVDANNIDNCFMLFDQSFDEALEFGGVTLVGTVELNG
jgi:hypothetical protein